jgi:hypothetical protein
MGLNLQDFPDGHSRLAGIFDMDRCQQERQTLPAEAGERSKQLIEKLADSAIHKLSSGIRQSSAANQ